MTLPPDPSPPSSAVHDRMSRQPRRDTKPELALRRALHAEGYRFRVNYPVPGKPRRTIDIAFTRAKLAVFVDGCFWHACPVHSVPAKNNAEWWRRKLVGNIERDRETDDLLGSSGWQVIRVWEHEDVRDAVSRVGVAVTTDGGTGNV